MSGGAAVARIAVMYPTDPAGSRPSGIDSVIRGILKAAPPDLDYYLFGASTDVNERPLGVEARVMIEDRPVRFLPLIELDSVTRPSRVPDVIRYMGALRTRIRRGSLALFDILDFHRIEPAWFFRRDSRPQNLVVHQDMSILRNPDCDIMWRRAPWLYEILEKRLYRGLDRIYCVRQTGVTRYQALYPELRDRFAFLPTWVDTSIFRPGPPAQHENRRAQLQSTLELPGAPRRFLVFVGRLDRQKDPQLLVRSFAEAHRRDPCLHLLLVGRGDLDAETQRACASLGITDRVSFMGVQPRMRIAEVLRASDLFLMASAYEGMPIAVLEALATGLPVVTTEVGEVGLVVNDGVSGRICTQRTPAAMADAIIGALARREAMCGAPCEQAVASYSPERILGAVFDNHRRQAARAPEPN